MNNSPDNLKAKLAVAALLALAATGVARADDTADSQPQTESESRLQLPADLTAAGDSARSVPYEESRIRGRLERVTVTRKSGLTEIYNNRRNDTLWSGPEKEIGEVPNKRFWIIGSW